MSYAEHTGIRNYVRCIIQERNKVEFYCKSRIFPAMLPSQFVVLCFPKGNQLLCLLKVARTSARAVSCASLLEARKEAMLSLPLPISA